jgi:hypothetical protein
VRISHGFWEYESAEKEKYTKTYEKIPQITKFREFRNRLAKM